MGLNLNKKIIFFSLTVLITIVFSFFAYDPPKVVIIGPEFPEQEYFIEELEVIADELGIKIKYNAISDTETYIIDNPKSNVSLAIIPNPQGVRNLAERELIQPLNTIEVDNISISNLYSNHLKSIVTYQNNIYAGWVRLFPNSLVWYDISKFNKFKTIDFTSFSSLLNSTKLIADNGISPWCSNSESGSSTGWIQTNWMEDLLLSKYGGDIYDRWSKLDINASNIEIYNTISLVGDFSFYPGHNLNRTGFINVEFRNLPKVLLDDNIPCFLSWSGHYFLNYIPDEYEYGIDFGVIQLPKINFENTTVGIGDSIVLVKDDNLSKIILEKILSKDFGTIWSSKSDSQYISANNQFDSSNIVNDLTKYEYKIVHDSLNEDNFRFDASELMPRPIGSDKLWEFFQNYIKNGPNSLVVLLNSLDKEF